VLSAREKGRKKDVSRKNKGAVAGLRVCLCVGLSWTVRARAYTGTHTRKDKRFDSTRR